MRFQQIDFRREMILKIDPENLRLENAQIVTREKVRTIQ